MVAARQYSYCPRCSDRLYELRYEPTCLQCGYADYSHDISDYRRDTIITSAALDILPYIGDSSAMRGRVVHVRMARKGWRIASILTCPFCRGDMKQLPGQNKLSTRRRELRYECAQGHRISTLTRAIDSSRLGWR